MPAQCLDPSALPPFKPTKEVIVCSNGPMSALRWAFSSCVPAMARSVFAGAGGASNATLRMNATPAMQWNYSMLHVAGHYESDQRPARKFIIRDEGDTAAILLEVTSLRACPDETDDNMNVLPRSEFVDPQDTETCLGALPIFFVRYFHEEKGKHPSWEPSKASTNFIRDALKVGGLVEVSAASVEEINFAHKELQRRHSLLGKSFKKGKFNDSVLFPTQIKKVKAPEKAPYVCAACDSIISARPAPSCSRCKVTYYCNRDCQVVHWKTGGHKKLCRKVPHVGEKKTGPRKSFVFDIDDAKAPGVDGDLNPGMTNMSINFNTGNVNVAGAKKEDRSEWKKHGHRVSKAPTSKNVYGDKEFIVKLQPPVGVGLPSGPWMCYDGPTRSFQAYIKSDTPGLPEVYKLLQREGVPSFNPMLHLPGYKGYFNAKWEGSSIRIFYDQIVSPQLW